MNIRSTMAPRPQTVAQTPPAQDQQGQEQQEPALPKGDTFARHASTAMNDYGVYAFAGAGGEAGFKFGSLAGVAVAVASGGGFVAATYGGLIGGAVGVVGGAYGGLMAGRKILDVAGNFGEKSLTSSPNVGRATGQAAALGVVTGLLSGSAGIGLGVVGISAAIGGYDMYKASKQ
jgi:hypothetical protein